MPPKTPPEENGKGFAEHGNVPAGDKRVVMHRPSLPEMRPEGGEAGVNCWEFRRCSHKAMQQCRAFPFFGTECWKKTGTVCGSGEIEKPSIREKIEYCRKCGFYINFAEKF